MQDLSVEDDSSGVEVIDQKFFEDNPQQSLSVMKDIELFATGGDKYDNDDDDDASVSVDFIRQTFSQIPTPGGALVLGLAGVGLAARRRH